MELYHFKKIKTLVGQGKVDITNADVVENIQGNEGHGGFGWAQFADVRVIVNRIFKVEHKEEAIASYIIEGDGVPRTVFAVIKLRFPLYNKTKEDNIDGLIDVVKQLAIKKKEYSSLQGISVKKSVWFYACIDNTTDTHLPDSFYVNESNIDFQNRLESLQAWNCFSNEQLEVNKDGHIYAKFIADVQLYTEEDKVMLFFYLNAIRKKLCTSCDHVWLPEDFLMLSGLANKYRKKLKKSEIRRGIVDASACELQTRSKDCQLWNHYFKGEIFLSAKEEACIIS